MYEFQRQSTLFDSFWSFNRAQKQALLYSMGRPTLGLFTESLPALPSPLMAMKHSSSGIPPSVLACRSHISPSGLRALFPRLPSLLLKPPLVSYALNRCFGLKPAYLGPRPDVLSLFKWNLQGAAQQAGTFYGDKTEKYKNQTWRVACTATGNKLCWQA